MKRILITLLAVFLSSQAAVAQTFKEGVEYERLPEPVATTNPDKVVVTELFWYGCPHCYRLEPYMVRWKQNKPADVELEILPSVLNPRWTDHARTYLAFEAMGVTDRIHQKLFSALHVENKRLNNLDALADYVKSQGLDDKAFREHFHSFPVDTQIRKNRQKEKKYGHRGVPTIVVNGKYRTSASMAGSNARLIQVLNYLVELERKS